MKKVHSILILFLFFSLCVQAQNAKKYTCFEISGLRTTIIQSPDEFKIEEKTSVELKREVHGDTLSISIIDERGQFPKGDIIIHTDSIKYLSISESVSVCPDTIHVDSLNLKLELASRGELKISANCLKVEVNTCSRLAVEGKANLLDSNINSIGFLDAKHLISQQAKVRSVEYGTLLYNAKETLYKDVDDKSKLSNSYSQEE